MLTLEFRDICWRFSWDCSYPQPLREIAEPQNEFSGEALEPCSIHIWFHFSQRDLWFAQRWLWFAAGFEAGASRENEPMSFLALNKTVVLYWTEMVSCSPSDTCRLEDVCPVSQGCSSIGLLPDFNKSEWESMEMCTEQATSWIIDPYWFYDKERGGKRA